MNDFDQLEQELSALRQHFAQSAVVLEDLSQIKKQFAELSQTHQALRASLAQTKQVLDHAPSPDQLDQRFVHLESQLDVRCEQLQAQLTNFRFDFDAISRQLREELERERQTQTLKTEHNKGIAGREESDRLKWLETSLQHLNGSIYADQANLQKLERRLHQLKKMVNVMAIIGGIGFSLLLLIIVFSGR